MWFPHPECELILRNIWNTSIDIVQAISKVLDTILPWNAKVFGNIFRRKKQVLARLAGTQKALSEKFNDFLHNLEFQLIQEYNQILQQEELFWYQKSTKFFHKSAVSRRRRNKILMLEIEGEWVKYDAILK